MTEAERIAQELDDNADLDAAEGGNPAVCKLEHDAAALLRNQAAEIERLREALADIVFHVDEAMRNEVQPYEVEKAFERASKALGVKHD